MILDKHTTVYVIDKRTGDVTTSCLDNWFLSIKGGSRWDQYEVTTDKSEADAISGKYKRIAKIVDGLSRLEPDLASQTADHILQEMDV